jgi:hypothetical protein
VAAVGLITTGAFFSLVRRRRPPQTDGARGSGSLNDSHDPIIQRPDENNSAVRLVWEESVALECGKCFGEFSRHRIERGPFRRDVSYLDVKSRNVWLSSEIEKFAYDLAVIVA